MMKSNIPSSLKNIDLASILRSRGIYDLQAKNKALKEAAIPMAKQLVASRRKSAPPTVLTHTQFTNEEVMSYWEKQIHIVDVLEKKFDNKVQQFIGKVVDGFLKHLEMEVSQNKSLAKVKDFFDESEGDLLTEAQLDFTPLLLDVAVLAGQEAYDLVKSRDVYTTTDIRKQVELNVERFTQSMLDTDRETLVDIISNGLTDGESIQTIRGEIVNKFEEFSKMQAQRITRTEVLRASNQASLDAYRSSGVVEGLQWLTAGATDECADYEGEIIALDGDFYSSESEFQDGYPPIHPNCRCVVLPVLIGEKAYVGQENKAMREAIIKLESQIDKRTKAFKELKAQSIDDQAYIKALEKYLGDEPLTKD